MIGGTLSCITVIITVSPPQLSTEIFKEQKLKFEYLKYLDISDPVHSLQFVCFKVFHQSWLDYIYGFSINWAIYLTLTFRSTSDTRRCMITILLYLKLAKQSLFCYSVILRSLLQGHM